MMLLAGDVGATKTRLGIFSPERGPRSPLAEAIFMSRRYPDMETLIGEFLAQTGLTVGRACFGVAGPVVGGTARITNLPWVIDERQLCVALDISSVRLLNDLTATAHAIPLLEPAELHTINQGQPVQRGNMAVIAPGTGLGEAFITWEGSRYREHPGEGGHADFAPNDPLEIELLLNLQEQFGHVSYENVCSGRGLPNIYRFLKKRRFAEEPSWLAEKLAGADDPVPVIVATALDQARPCKLCVEALNIFVSVLGAEAGNLALKALATGGVYLTGGIPPRILPFLDKGRFMKAFRHKGRMSDLVARMPVYVVLNSGVALLGAACYGLSSYEEGAVP
ncbi:MAG: glucokinase [Syntrophales bacterium]|nr:glucokinase [Syntrophales bacterium]